MVYPKLLKYFVSSDKHKPLRELIQRGDSRVDAYNTKYRRYELRLNRLIDDTSQLSSPKIAEEYSSSELESSDTSARNSEQLHCPQSIIDGPRFFLCAPYIRYNYDATGKILTMSRSYKGVITILGEFGGVIKILTAVVFFLYSIYSSRKIKPYFSTRIFKFDKKQSESFQEVLMRNNELVGGEGLGQTQDYLFPGEKSEEREKEEERGEIKNLIEECVQSKFKAADMMYKLSLLEILEDVLFEEHDKTLLPIVILNRFKNKEEMKKISKKQKSQKSRKSKSPALKKHLAKKSVAPSLESPDCLDGPQLHQNGDESGGEGAIQTKKSILVKRTKKKNRAKFSIEGEPSVCNQDAENTPDQGSLELFAAENFEEINPTNKINFESGKQSLNPRTILDEEELKIKNNLKRDKLNSKNSQFKPEEEEGSKFDKAYNDLISSSPKNEIKRLIRSYMINHVKAYFQKPNKGPEKSFIRGPLRPKITKQPRRSRFRKNAKKPLIFHKKKRQLKPLESHLDEAADDGKIDLSGLSRNPEGEEKSLKFDSKRSDFIA